MFSHFLAQFLLLFPLAYADSMYSKVHYITPSLDSPCPQNASSCLTLSQFAANSSHSETDVSLLFLPGYHLLNQELLLAHGHDLSMSKYAKDNETVFVKCISQLGRFDINKTTSVSIIGLTFLGCGGNRVSQATWLTIADSIFQGVKDKSAVLEICKVIKINIVRSQFFNNTQCHDDNATLEDLQLRPIEDLDYVYHQRNTPSGVLYTAFSNISIVNCRFTYNRVDIGGALIAHNSSVYIKKSALSHNTAKFGGAMVISGSTIDIDNSIFTHNSVQGNGGVMVTHNDNISINSSAFSENNADRGGIFTSHDSSFTINNSNFTSNRATSGGVMYTSGYSSFNISNCNFTSNSATTYGGAMITFGNCSFIISNSNFTSNRATSGGVMYTSGDSSFNINNSIFTSSRATNGGVMYTSGYSSFNISNSNFTSNSANDGGVMATFGDSSFTISNSNFTSNRVIWHGGVMYTSHDSSFTISNSNFSSNSATIFGGVMYSSGDSSFTISNSNFTSNIATTGGVMCTSDDSSFTISNCYFTSNNVTTHGGVMTTFGYSLFTISNSNFIFNSAYFSGGVMITYSDSSFIISSTNFTSNSATKGGVMKTSGTSSFTISNCNFSSNSATDSGGVVYASDDSSFAFSNSNFTSNSASHYGGVMATYFGDTAFTINNSNFTSNRATDGGVMDTYGSDSFTISNSNFTSNSATDGGVIKLYGDPSFTINASFFTFNNATNGGVMYTSGDYSFTISNSNFISNSATSIGLIYCKKGTLNVENSKFSSNTINTLGEGLIFMNQCYTSIANTAFDDNVGSIYTFNSNLNFSGNSKFKNCTELFIAGNEYTSQEGGVITSFQSTVIFRRGSTTHFSNSQARDGGAILAIESTIIIYGETTITNNIITTTANSSGGGISLKQSHLEINLKGKCNLVNNSAVRGGGIHATSSTITVYKPGTLQLISNNAKFGGGMYLDVNCKVYVLKTDPTYSKSYFMNFTGNHANYGGAVYVADDTNSGTCSPDNECFIQILALHQMSIKPGTGTMNILFSENTATEQGSNLFGGLLDRCIPSPFSEVYKMQKVPYSGVLYFQKITENAQIHSISSQPVRVCFCNIVRKPNCNYQLPTIMVKKGEAFNVSVVAVDQVNNTVDANIIASISSSDGGFGEGQQTQSVGRNCTDLTYNVFSPHDNETINLFADGPCGSAVLSTSHVTIHFKQCTCPVGFEPLSNNKSSTRCECICDSSLSPYITDCNHATSLVSRVDTNSWITYINNTGPPGYVKYPYCPFDYCRPTTDNVSINFNIPNGADTQCAYNRTRVLCGSCREKSSLSLASSRCLPCHSHWPAVCVVILLSAILAGVLLVTALLALNMTVSVGLINGFIFYANIVSAGSAVFFPSSESSFPSVFVAWLNLEIGIDVCFIYGLNAYIKTWLQLAFPMYIICLVVMVIIVSEYSPKFTRLIGRKDPVSTLATLILLSYAKLLSVTITALSFAKLDYPDGKQQIVWLPDGNVKYFQGKHIPLVFVALLIVLIGLPYTILFFLWQWIVRAPRWKIFQWTRNTKLNAFIATYHVPYNSKYRYWTGLLLLVRVVLYVTASITVSANPQTFPLLSIIFVGGLFLFKGVVGLRVYKNSLVDIVDTVLYFNLLALAGFTLYDFRVNPTKQTAVAYTSIILTFILFIGSIFYHLKLLCTKKKPSQVLKEYPLAPVQATDAEVTYSVIDPPKHDQDSLLNIDSDETEISETVYIATTQTQTL